MLLIGGQKVENPGVIGMLEVEIKKKLRYFELDVRFDLSEKILVLWAPSGAGKTTILHCLSGLFTPTSGSVVLNNKILYSSKQKINIRTRKRNIGYLFQDYALFPHLSVKQNIMYGPRCHKQKKVDLMAMLTSLGIDHLVDRYPYQISGGEKQRVALARALILRPELLLLDEPLSAVDQKLRLALQKELKAINRKWKIPFIVVTHDEEEAKYLGDKILYLHNGKIYQAVNGALPITSP